MSDDIVLSIVSVTYNDGEGLRRTLESCRNQRVDRRDCEILVIDGGSTDATKTVIGEYADVVTIFISEPDRGIYHAMNKGLGRARGSYVMYLNSGDIFSDSSALASVKDALYGRNPTWLIGGAISLDGGTHSRLIKNMPHSWFRHAYGQQPHCHQSTIVKRSLLEAVGGFSEEYEFAGDFDLLLRIGLVNEPTYLQGVIITYAGGGVSAINGDRIPGLQHRVRVDRFELSHIWEKLDRLYMHYQVFRRRLHPTVSKAKSILASVRSQSCS